MKVYVRPHNSNWGQIRRVEVAVDHRENKSMVQKELAKELQLKMSTSGLAFDVSQDGKTWHPVVDASVVKKFELEGREPNWADFGDQNPDFKTIDLAFNYASPNPVKILLGADVQDLWMPTETRKKWIRARRLLGYQTKLGLAVSGPFLGIRRMSYILEEQYKEQERFWRTSRARLMSSQPKINYEERKKKEDSRIVSRRFPMRKSAEGELVRWMKANFWRKKGESKKYREGIQQVVRQVAIALDQSGFQVKKSGLNQQKVFLEKRVSQKSRKERSRLSVAANHRVGLTERSTSPRTRSGKERSSLSRTRSGKQFCHASSREGGLGSSMAPGVKFAPAGGGAAKKISNCSTERKQESRSLQQPSDHCQRRRGSACRLLSNDIC
jgi:hypothetical protein